MNVTCPQCSRVLDAPYPLPAMAKCPFCAAVFTPVVPAVPPQPPPLPPIPTGAVLQPSGAALAGQAFEAVRAPAVGLIVVAVLNIAWSLFDVLGRIYLIVALERGQAPPPLPPPFDQFGKVDAASIMVGFGFDLMWLAVGAFVIYGAVKMQRLQSFGAAVSASIVSVIPCVTCCCVLGMPFGIWSLIVLNRSEVRSAFQ